MRKLGLLLAALAFGGPAFAADMAVKMPVKAPPPPPAPVYSWTGFYIGGNAGYGWNDPTVSVTPNDIEALGVTCCGFGSSIPLTTFNIGGALGGLQAGYNWQVNQNWLLGFETDFDWSNIKGTGTSSFSLDNLPSSFQASETVKWFGTVRGRIGFLPLNNFLLYATGSLAYGRVDALAAINSNAIVGVGRFSSTATPLSVVLPRRTALSAIHHALPSVLRSAGAANICCGTTSA
jgi:outer membrane immunogenic protein